MAEHEIELLGADHLSYGELSIASSGSLHAAMSIGGDPTSPSLKFKGAIKNEDALSARDVGRYARLVVADSHYGNQSSHLLVQAAHVAPCAVAQPKLAIAGPSTDDSATSFTSVWLDRETSEVQVDSFGDSLALRLRTATEPVLLVEGDHRFVTPQSFDWNASARMSCTVAAGDVLLAFTDGVNECHYREPETSLTLAHIQQMFERAAELADFVRTLGDAALAGVDGYPGGQDNIAIAAVQV